MQYTTDCNIFNKICEILNLGYVKGEPSEVSGGLLHNVYKLHTTKDRYAVKLLNPQIVSKPQALSNFIFSEKVARIVCDNGISALPALLADNDNIPNIDGHYFLVFPWLDGEAVISNSIDVVKCITIGGILAAIHGLDFSSLANDQDKTNKPCFIDWNIYIKTIKSLDLIWKDLFLQNIFLIMHLYENTVVACNRLNKHLVISHRDLLQKNVLWNTNNVPTLIDWESAGYINPGIELLDVSLFWSGGHKGLPDLNAFGGFLNAYLNRKGIIPNSINDIINARFMGKFDWLIKNIECSFVVNDIDEQKIISSRVIKAINAILVYNEIIPKLSVWLEEAFNH